MDGPILVATDEPTILIAEDDKFDQLILKRAFRAAQLGGSVHFVEHGEKLLDYLQECKCPIGKVIRPIPSIIFLDLNMPVLDGWKTLRRIRTEFGLPTLPIVIMSTIRDAREIKEVLALGANHYFTKPVHFDELVTIIRSCVTHWLSTLT